mmetsp:Transcript_18928/g.26050  ORF Transcript_18928/g.26050 Transcript_18928/m.26050 type:complete len:101 (+) Transcript_18928:187-489(+)
MHMFILWIATIMLPCYKPFYAASLPFYKPFYAAFLHCYTPFYVSPNVAPGTSENNTTASYNESNIAFHFGNNKDTFELYPSPLRVPDYPHPRFQSFPKEP